MALSDAMSPFSSTGDLIARARTAFQSGRHAEAEKLAAEARTHDRASLDAIEILALAHRAHGDAAGAERLLREAIAIDSHPRWPHDKLAMI